MRVLVPLPIDLSVMANGRTLRVVHLLRELHNRCSLTCLVPDDRRALAARRALSDLRIECVPAAEPATTRTWPADLLPLDTISRRALAFVGFEEPLVRATVRRAADHDAVLGFDLPSLACLLAVRHARREGRPRLCADLIDDPRLTYRSLPASERLSVRGLKLAAVVSWLRRRLIGRLDAASAAGPRDAASLARATGLNVAVVPNGVALPDDSCLQGGREPLVVFTGAMQFPPNAAAARWFVRRVWPLVREATAESKDPETRVRLAIVGTCPGERVRRLGEAPGVTVTGRVDDVTAWLARAAVAVAPMVTGSGIKNKVLEAAAAACPVVATPLGVEGLPAGERRGWLVADSPARFAEHVVALLRDAARARAMGEAGRETVSRRYGWPGVAKQMRAVLEGGTPTGSDRVRAEAHASLLVDPIRGRSTASAGSEEPSHAAS